MNKEKPLAVWQIIEKYGGGKLYRQTLYNHFKLGNLPFVKQKSHYFVYEADFLAWFEKFKAGEFVYRPTRVVWKEPEETAASEQVSTAKSA